jgi:dTMP kinase
VDLATLRRLTYLDAVTREVRRATPVLPLTFFGTVARDLSFRGIRIPKGHRAVGCIGATLLDEDVFADAARFDPDRWQRPDERQTRAWVPHGGGAHASGHRCAGERLADVMMKLVAVHLLRGCSFALAPDQDFAPTKNKLFATPAGYRCRRSRAVEPRADVIDKVMAKRLPHGALIVFEGIDGAGKTTQAHRLVEAVRDAGLAAVYSKEPTDGVWGAKIRRSAEAGRMPMEEELRAFLEDRREHVRDVVEPALESGSVVVLDRYYFSNAAYQGARGADVAAIVAENEAFAPQPNLLLFLDVPVDVGLGRVRARGQGVTSFEVADALEKSAAIFRSFDRPYWRRLDGRQPVDDVTKQVMDLVTRTVLTGA